jgi:hypothetical protein
MKNNHAYNWQKKQQEKEKKEYVEYYRTELDRPTRRERERVCFTFERHIPKENKIWWKSLTLDQKWDVVTTWDSYENNSYTAWSNYYIAPRTEVSSKSKFLNWLSDVVERIKPPIAVLRDNKLKELLG